MTLTLSKMGIWESSGIPKNLEFDCRGQNTLPWGVFYTVRKVLKCRCWKWLLHEPFGHLQHKLWMKKGLGVKLPIWLLTIKSRELTRPRCVQVECDTPLESSWGELQVGFRPHSIRSLSKKLWTPKVPGVQTGTVSGLLLGTPGKKCHSDVGAMGKRREYYMGESGGFPRVWAMVSQVSPRSPVACASTKSAPECELTNLLVGLM
jgi:hypothetical protein